MHQQRKEVLITFRHQQPCWCPDKQHHYKNKIIFALEPQEGIIIEFWSKRPGLQMSLERRTIDFMLRSPTDKPQYIEEYEKLVLDAVAGDQTLFVSSSEIKAMWQFVDPILQAWQQGNVPLHKYNPDSDEAVAHSLKVIN